MKNFLLGLIFIAAGMLACESKQNTLNESQRDAMIDSIVGTHIGEINQQAMEDFDRRKSIEVKAKADSIVAVMTGTNTAPPADHTSPGSLPTR